MPTQIEPFDIDAWLTDAAPPQRSVTVYGRGDLIARYQDLAAAPPVPGDERLGGNVRTAELDAVKDQIEASAITLHVRGLTHDERARLMEQHTAGETFDAIAYEHAAVTVCLVSPTLTDDQVQRMHAAIGEGQWVEITQAIRRAGDEPVDVPLSRLGSESTPTS